MRAELAHAEHHPCPSPPPDAPAAAASACPAVRIARAGSRSPRTRSRRRDRRAARRSRRCRIARQGSASAIRKCASTLSRRSAITSRLADVLAFGSACDLRPGSQPSRSPTGTSNSSVQPLRLAPRACRAGRPTGRTPRRGNPAPGRLRRQERGQPRQPGLLRGLDNVVERRLALRRDRAALERRQSSPDSSPCQPASAHRHSSFASGKVIVTTVRSGIVVRKVQPPAVELHHRLGQAEAEARARLRAALLQPHEALGRALAVGRVGNARAVVGDLQADLAAVGGRQDDRHQRPAAIAVRRNI